MLGITTTKTHKRTELKDMIDKLDDIVVRDRNHYFNDGNDFETNSKASAGKCHSDRRRRASVSNCHNGPQRRLGLTKSFSSKGFRPLENDGEDDGEQHQTPLQKPLTVSDSCSPSSATVATPTTVTSTIFSNSKSNFESPKLKESPSGNNNEKRITETIPSPPLPPRRARSGSFTANRRRSSAGLPRPGASIISTNSPKDTRLEALEDELDRLNAESTRVQFAQEDLQQKKLRAGTRYQQLQDEFDALQRDVLHKLEQIESSEAENDRLKEECLHYETQVFSMTKSMEMCVAKREAKSEEYNLIYQEWAKTHQLGSDLLQALHEYHTAASSPDHVDLELNFRHQQELLEEMQKEVRQLREEVCSIQYEVQVPPPRANASSGQSILIIPDPPQSRISNSVSPKRTVSSTFPQSVTSPSSRSSGSSQSRCDAGICENTSNQRTSKDRRRIAAQELRQDLQHRRHRRSSLTSNDDSR